MSPLATLNSFRRILLKLSGEFFGNDPTRFEAVAQSVKAWRTMGKTVGLVVGGGNIMRGGQTQGDRVDQDSAGMLGTVINALTLQDALRAQDIDVSVMAPAHVSSLVFPFNRTWAQHALKRDTTLIFAGGLGVPFFSTDTTAVVRALELDFEAVFKGTNVGGVFSKDPKAHKDAVFFPELSHKNVLDQRLHVMDLPAIALAETHCLPIVVFDLEDGTGPVRLFSGASSFTVVKSKKQEAF